MGTVEKSWGISRILASLAFAVFVLFQISPVLAQNVSNLSAAFASPAQVVPGENAESLAPHIRFRTYAEGELTAQILASDAFATKLIPASNDNYGDPGARIVATLAVQNVGDEDGRWLLTTARASFRHLKIGELDAGDIRWLADREAPDMGENLRTYDGLGVPIEIAAGETRYFVVDFTGSYSSILPLRISDSESFFRDQKVSVAMVFGSVVGMLTIIMACVLLVGATGRWDFMWLALSELMHAAFILQVAGYAVFYFLHDKGEWVYSTTYILSCLYGATTAQFARRLLSTRQSYPRLDRAFRGGIAIALITVGAFVLGTVFDLPAVRSVAKLSSTTLFATFSVCLPIVAVFAIRREGWHYLPLLPAWLMTGSFVVFGFVASQDLIPGLLFSWRIYSPVGLFSALCLMFTAALQMREVHRGKQRAERDLLDSLTEKLRLLGETRDLKQAQALAIATLEDQDRLIHASGHDSRQVVLALNSIVQFLETRRDLALPTDVGDTLRASAQHLEDVIATTLSGGMAVSDMSGPVVLSRFELAGIFRQLALIYRPKAHKKGLGFEIGEPAGIELICDRAILSRILSNLVSNAVKFSSAGTIAMTVSEHDDLVTIRVSDDGCGMDAALLARLTNGTRELLGSDHETEGTGFGFKASLALVERLSGTFSVESSPGQGTSVEVTLPLRASGAAISAGGLAALARERGIACVNPATAAMSTPGSGSSGTGIPIIADRSAIACDGRSDVPVALQKPLCSGMLDHPLIARHAAGSRFQAA